MKQRFFFSIIFTAVIFVLAVLVSGGAIITYIDLPTFIIVGIVPLLYQLILFGCINFKKAFLSPLKKECSAEDASNALAFFKAYNKSVWMFSAAAVGISLITIFTHLDNPETLGPNLAVTFLSILYAALINLLLILPYITITKRRLSESEL